MARRIMEILCYHDQEVMEVGGTVQYSVRDELEGDGKLAGVYPDCGRLPLV